MRHPPASPALLTGSRLPNRWDLLLLPLVFGLIFLLAWGGHQMAVPYEFGEQLPISLDPARLPEYALRTTLRMGIALLGSLLFTFAYAKAAVGSRRAEQILIPLLDILQSVPILGFLSITVLWFVHLFPGSLLGPECAAIFAIFTSQAWNMAFSFYYSLRMLPKDLYQVANLFQLSAWQRFWRLEAPYALPGLVWNAMMSVSGGWFFVVAAEAITVSDRTVLLPGIGSYIAVAIDQRDLTAVGYAILAMLVVILLTDQLLF
jgi:NitT/TauT family transport system permease protein